MFASVSLWWDPMFAGCYCLTDIGLELGSPDTVLSYGMLGNGHQQVFQTKRLFFKRTDSSFGLLIDWWTCLHVPAGAWPFSAQTVLEKGAQLPWNLNTVNSSVLFIVFNYKTCRFWKNSKVKSTQEAVTVADKWQSAKKACVINHFWRKNFDKINTLYFNGEENKFFSCFFFFTVRWSLCLLLFKIVSINSVKILFIFVSLLYNLF